MIIIFKEKFIRKINQMFLLNFFNSLLKDNRNDQNQIIKYSSNKNSDFHAQINNKLIEIDEKISENSKALLEAQIVKLRSTFSQSTNFIDKIGKNIYKTKIEESINWHQNQLKELYSQRKILKIQLEKIKGIYLFNLLYKQGYEKRIKKDNGCLENAKYKELKVK